MSLIKIATVNGLELATTVTPTIATVTGNPTSRLYDRNTARPCTTTAAGARSWLITLPSAQNYNTLILGPGHNVGGSAYTLERSSNGTDWTSASSGNVAAGAGAAAISFTGMSRLYWRLGLPADASTTLTEVWLCAPHAFLRNPSRPSGALENKWNVEVDETSAGSARFIEHGPVRRVRNYDFPNISEAEAIEVAGCIDALEQTRPFWLCDHRGAWIFGILDAPLVLTEVAAGRFSFAFNFVEVLG